MASDDLKAKASEDWKGVVEALRERKLLEPVSDIVRGFRVTMYEAAGKNRMLTVARARHAAWRYLRDEWLLSYPEIGRIWGVHPGTVRMALIEQQKGPEVRERCPTCGRLKDATEYAEALQELPAKKAKPVAKHLNGAKRRRR